MKKIFFFAIILLAFSTLACSDLSKNLKTEIDRVRGELAESTGLPLQSEVAKPDLEEFGLSVVTAEEIPLIAESLEQNSSDFSSLEETASKQRTSLALQNFQEFSLKKVLAEGEEIAAFSSATAGRRVFVAGNKGSVALLSLEGSESSAVKKASARTLFRSTKPIIALALSSDERFLAVSQFSAVYVFDLQSGTFVNALTQVRGRIFSLAWDPRGEFLVLGMASGEAYVWQLKYGVYAGRNSLKAVELYNSRGESPLVKILLHPSGRAFFALAQDGRVSLWRLLRTERELGLRDEDAEIDEGLKGKVREDIGRVPTQIEDAYLDRDAGVIFIAGADGKVYSFKVRGTLTGAAISASKDSLRGVAGLTFALSKKGSKTTSLLATVDRAPRLSFFCRSFTEKNGDVLNSDADGTGAAVKIIRSKDTAAEDSSGPQVVAGRLLLGPEAAGEVPESEANAAGGAEDTAKSSALLLAQSQKLKEPVSGMSSSPNSSLLWLAQKRGSLLAFNAQLALRQIALNPGELKCLAK